MIYCVYMGIYGNERWCISMYEFEWVCGYVWVCLGTYVYICLDMHICIYSWVCRARYRYILLCMARGQSMNLIDGFQL